MNSDTLIGRVLHNKSVWTVVINHMRQKIKFTGLEMTHCVGPKDTAAGK